MIKTFQYCDRCKKLLKEDRNAIEPMYGIIYELGFSNGGWGSRQDIGKSSGEVCGECFKTFQEMATQMVDWFWEYRKG